MNKPSNYAPVLVFAYRRPEHLKNTLSSLMRCEGFSESPIIIYGDGPRDSGEVDTVEATREIARSMLGEKADYRFNETNLGLARSVIRGVTETVHRFDRVIVVEDDLQLSPSFLSYMNKAIDRYAKNDRVFQVSGYMFDVPETRHSQRAMFLPLTVSWGWATWKRAWEHFDPLASGWEGLRTDKKLRRRFNLNGAYDYAAMLIRQMRGEQDSWAIRWYWSVFKKNGIVLFPPVSLVRNYGMDGSGSHGRGRLRRFAAGPVVTDAHGFVLPDAVQLDPRRWESVRKAIWRMNGGWVIRSADWIRSRFRN